MYYFKDYSSMFFRFLNMSSYNNLSSFVKKLDPPKLYPGKLNRKNKDGTLLTKSDWILAEAKTWFTTVKRDPCYDEAIQHEKVLVLGNWLNKSFKFATSETKKILVDIEFNEKDIFEPPDITDSKGIRTRC